MSFLSSDKVYVFPSVGRGSYQYNARNLSEYNLSNLINQLVSCDGFVISCDSSGLEFNIKGYYFKIDHKAIPSELFSNSNIYAEILVCDHEVQLQGSKVVNFKELSPFDSGIDPDNLNTDLAPLDNNNQFIGLKFVNNESGGNVTSLRILTCDSNGWHVPNESFIAFDSSRFNLGDIIVDGGELPSN